MEWTRRRASSLPKRKEFEILVKRDERPDHDESTILSIDGSVCVCAFGDFPSECGENTDNLETASRMSAHTFHRNQPKMNDTFNGKRVSATEIRPFVFAPIALTDDPDEAVQDEKIIQGLGTIRLNFHRVIRQGTHKSQRHGFTDAPAQRVSDACTRSTLPIRGLQSPFSRLFSSSMKGARRRR